MAANDRQNTSNTLGNIDYSAFDMLKDSARKGELNRKELRDLKRYEEMLEEQSRNKSKDEMKRIQEELHKDRLNQYEKENNKFAAGLEKIKHNFVDGISGGLQSTTNSLVSAIDNSLNKYLQYQQSMTAHLQGSANDFYSISNRLSSALNTNSLVRQEKVYDNLSKLVNSGIVYNVEQRAFLQTLADDINMVFDATNGSLTRLIRLQGQDLSANRVAIEYSLQRFLNQNYQTSEYIKSSFAAVSDSLITAQAALQNTSEAVRLEAAVQTQLGAMYSSGMSSNTVQGLAQAINALGSGDISNIGSGMSNLLVMAAARAGMDYGDLLNRGVTGNQATTLLNSVTSYLSEMSQNQSNVVKSQLASVFGVNLTDLLAARNTGQISGSVSSNIGTFLNDYSGFVNFGSRLTNLIENGKWGFGTNMASNEGLLMSYQMSKLISQSGVGGILNDLGEMIADIDGAVIGAFTGAAGGVLRLLGLAANNAPLFPIISSLFGENGFINEMYSSYRAGQGGMGEIFDLLSGRSGSGVTVKSSGAGVSGSMYLGTGSATDILNSSVSSINSLASQVVTVTGDETVVTWQDNVETITSNTTEILDILNLYMESISDNLNVISNSTAYSAGGVVGLAYSVANHVI